LDAGLLPILGTLAFSGASLPYVARIIRQKRSDQHNPWTYVSVIAGLLSQPRLGLLVDGGLGYFLGDRSGIAFYVLGLGVVWYYGAEWQCRDQIP